MIRQPFTVVTKPTGAACNLDCTYCFFLSKELLYDHGSQMMSVETLDTYLARYLDAQPDGVVPLIWQGGEPTLRGLDFFHTALTLADRYARPGQHLSHAIQTNGTLLNDDWCSFFKEHDVLVGISIDGTRAIHDTFRVNKAGRGTFDQVERGWRLLQKHHVDTNILCTIHGANEDHGREIYRFFRDDLGARFLQFIPIVERVPAHLLPLAEQGWHTTRTHRLLYTQHGHSVTSRSVSPEGFGRFLSEIFDEWLAHDVGTVYVQHFDTMLGNLLGQFSACVHAPECGNALAVEHNGDVYSCDHYVEPDYLLGNITRDDTFPAMLRSPFQRAFGEAKLSALPKQCLSCTVRRFCNGGCPKDRFVDAPDTSDHSLNYLCPGYHAFFTHARPAIIGMSRLLRAGRAPADIMNPEVAAHVIPRTP